MNFGEPCRVLLADPPWRFGDKLPGPSRGAEKNYATLSVDELLKFPIPPLGDNAWLLLWRVASMQQEALDVVKAWGFTLKTEIVWRKTTVTGKVHFGMGRYTRAAHETCLVAVRGRVKPASKSVRDIFDAPVRKHSQKPDEFFPIANQLVGLDGRRVELFSRQRRAGWECYGNELPALEAA